MTVGQQYVTNNLIASGASGAKPAVVKTPAAEAASQSRKTKSSKRSTS
jgi:hypothetical protein